MFAKYGESKASAAWNYRLLRERKEGKEYGIETKQQDTFQTVVSLNKPKPLGFRSNFREILYLQRASHKKMFQMNEFWFYSESMDSKGYMF